MKLNIQQYFIGFLIIACLFSFMLTWPMTLSYIAYTVATIVFLHWIPKNQNYEIVGISIAGGMFLSYFIRPFLLNIDPSIYMYKERFNIGIEEVEVAVIQSTTTSIILYVGFLLGLRFITKKPTTYDQSQSTTKLPFFLHNKTLILLFSTFLVLLYGFLVLVLDIGIKGEEVKSPLAFLQRLIPKDLIFGVAMIYIYKYWSSLTWLNKSAIFFFSALLSVTILATGSKGFLMILLFAYGVIMMHNNYQLAITRFFTLFSVGFVLLSISFILAHVVKISNSTGLSFEQTVNIAISLTKEISLFEILSDITSRFVGLDGTIVANKVLSVWNSSFVDKLLESFKPTEILLHSMDQTLPGVKVSHTIVCGTAVGRYVSLVPDEQIFGGALGSVAAFSLSLKSYAFIGKFVLGFLLARYALLVQKVKDADLKYILIFFISYTIVFALMSGNFDLWISLTVTKLALTGIYIYMIFIFSDMFRLTKQPT